MNRLRVVLVVLFLCFSMEGQAIHFHDVAYWQFLTFTNFESGKWRAYTQIETRLEDHMRDDRLWRFREALRYRFCSNLDFEVHYAFTESRPAGVKGFRPNHRVEFEINPFWNLNKDFKLQHRNRYEVIREFGSNSLVQHLRHRSLLAYSLKNKGCLKSISISDEIFYSLTTKEFYENRFIPVLLSLKVTRQVQFSPFIMLMTRRNGSKWDNSLVLGSYIDL